MAEAKRDQNHITTLITADSADGTSIVNIQVDPTTHVLRVEDASTGSDFGPENANREGNHVPVLMAVSSADGVTPVVVYGNSSGQLLIDSN